MGSHGERSPLAVQASRAQADKARYRARMKRIVERTQFLVAERDSQLFLSEVQAVE